jgi:hypothetical protein
MHQNDNIHGSLPVISIPNSFKLVVILCLTCGAAQMLGHEMKRREGLGFRCATSRTSCAPTGPRSAAKPARVKLVFLYCTGCRVGEAVELEWPDLNLQHARTVPRDTKNGTDRIVDLPPRAIAALSSLPHRRGHVFRQRAANHTGRQMTVKARDTAGRSVAFGTAHAFAPALSVESRHMRPATPGRLGTTLRTAMQ